MTEMMMDMAELDVPKGLEGVKVDRSAISLVDGEAGRLTYRGYDIREVIEQPSEAVIWLLLAGEFPDQATLSELSEFLLEQSELTDRDLSVLSAMPAQLHPMRMLQAFIPLMAAPSDVTFRNHHDLGLGLAMVARLLSVVAWWRCRERGVPWHHVEGEDRHTHFLTAFNGQEPAHQDTEILNVVQILQMEHSFNAGTFAARVVTSTEASVQAALAAGCGALSGPLHGGADEQALLNARAVGFPDAVPAHIEEVLREKRKLMGMGHREYRTVDPRAVILKPMAIELCEGTDNETLCETLVAIDDQFSVEMAKRGKDIHANVEFYKGAVFLALGIPAHYFTAMFACARAVGWLAHYMEAKADNRLIRPQAVYCGPSLRSYRH